MGKYRKHSPEKKAGIVLEILRGEKSVDKRKDHPFLPHGFRHL